MKTLTFSLTILAGLSVAALANPVPYGSPGTTNLVTYTFSATATGDVVAYFAGQTAGYGSDIGLSINGAAPTIYGLQNHLSAYGDSLVLGSVVAGDILRFVIRVSASNFYGPPPVSYTLNSDASLNGGTNHIYSSTYGGDSFIPAGTYIGFEDLLNLGDKDYDDHQFVFTNVGVSSSAVPDAGSSLALLGMAMSGMAWFRRKLS